MLLNHEETNAFPSILHKAPTYEISIFIHKDVEVIPFEACWLSFLIKYLTLMSSSSKNLWETLCLTVRWKIYRSLVFHTELETGCVKPSLAST